MSYDRTSIDLTNCDKEPIHIPGSIQPHGSMIVVDPRSSTIVYMSSNVGERLDVSLEDAIGNSLDTALGDKLTHDFRNALAVAATGQKTGVIVRVDPGERGLLCDILVHEFGGLRFLECGFHKVRDTDFSKSRTAISVSAGQ